MISRFDPDAERVRTAARAMGEALSKTVCDLTPTFASTHGLTNVETCAALASAYSINMVGALIVGYGLTDDKIPGLRTAIDNAVNDWLEAQDESDG